MAQLKNTSDIARAFGISEETIKAGKHYPFLVGYLTAVIDTFLLFAEDAKTLEEVKKHIHTAFDDLTCTEK